MAGIQNFRGALGGFNRSDVVNYIEYLNTQHKAQIAQLNTQLQNAQEALEKAQAVPCDTELRAQLEAAQARCAELEAALAAKGAPTDSELEAYRRAERVERMAQDRASQIHDKANAALADATVKVEAAADGMKSVAEQLTAQLENAQQQLQDAVATMYAIRPEE